MLNPGASLVLVHNRYQQRGGEDAVFEAERALLESRGHRVHVLEFDNAVVEERKSPLGALRLAVDTVWSRSSSARVAEAVKEHGAELVHFHNTFPLVSPAAYGAARKAGAVVVQRLPNYRLICPSALLYRDEGVCHDCVSKAVPWPAVVHACYRKSPAATSVVGAMLVFHKALGTWKRNVDLFVSPSEATRQEYLGAGFAPDQIITKPNFIDGVADAGSGDPERRGVLFVGRLDPSKGVQALMDAWKLRGDQGDAGELRIIGGGPMATDVERFAAGDPSVRYEGPMPREAVLRAMAESGVLVFPSEWLEPFGITIIEAFATGLPVIAGAIGGPAELVEDGRTGLLFKPGDAADLASKLQWAAAHPAEMAAMGRTARAEYDAQYTGERNYQMLMDIYERAIQRRKAAS